MANERPTVISVLSEVQLIVSQDISGLDNELREIMRTSNENNLTVEQAAKVASMIHGTIDRLNKLARFAEGKE